MGKKTSAKDTPLVLEIEELKKDYYMISIVGITPLIMDRITRKQKRQVLGDIEIDGEVFHYEKPDKLRDPVDEFVGAMHQLDGKHKAHDIEFELPFLLPDETEPVTFTASIKPAFRSIGIKKGMVFACRAKKNLNMSDISQLVFAYGDLFPIEFKTVRMEEFETRSNTKGKALILKYLPVFYDWSATVLVGAVSPTISTKALMNLLNMAGDICGLGVRRPERGGRNGQYRVRGAITRVKDIRIVQKWEREHAYPADYL